MLRYYFLDLRFFFRGDLSSTIASAGARIALTLSRVCKGTSIKPWDLLYDGEALRVNSFEDLRSSGLGSVSAGRGRGDTFSWAGAIAEVFGVAVSRRRE